MPDSKTKTTAITAGIQQLAGLQSPVRSIEFHGRSLFELYRVNLADGRAIAAKLVASIDMARTESEGLQALGDAGAPVPRCYGAWQNPTDAASPPILFMDFLSDEQNDRESRRNKKTPKTPAAEQLVEDLSRLYAASSPEKDFGWHTSNFIGSLSQSNGPRKTFSEFWWEDRLHVMFQSAHTRGLLPATVGRELEAVLVQCTREWGLDQLKPRLVHGDLWSGNLVRGPGGRFYLIDPSVARSNPEQDLAMLDLFGSPLNAGQMEQIARTAGIGPGLKTRIPFWQIYPLLVHVNLFGASYIGQLQSALNCYR